MENILQSLAGKGESELISIIQSLLQKFGDDANEIVTQILGDVSGSGVQVEQSDDRTDEKKEEKKEEKKPVNKGTSVKSSGSAVGVNPIAQYKAEKKDKKKKEFDMLRYRQRHIAIQIQYEGEPYYGFTSQTGGCEETVEKHIFEALLKLRLITDRHTCNYSRCGRTDRGVSALGQTIALKVRSSIPLSIDSELMPKHPSDSILVPVKGKIGKNQNDGRNKKQNGGGRNQQNGGKNQQNVLGKKRKESEIDGNEGIITVNDDNAEERADKGRGEGEEMADNGGDKKGDNEEGVIEYEELREMDYCSMLNRVLPDSIRALGWCEVTPEFSSRFSCAYRKYRYFFVKRDLDIEKMNIAASLLVGDHDFRNICKIDIAKVSNFRREVYSAVIIPFQVNNINPDLSVYMLEIRGIAFLWHMVRCIMALLFMVGEGHEEPRAITALLDVENMPAKPHYKMAPDLSLVLHECGFDNMKILLQPPVLWTLTGHFEALWEKHTIAASRAKSALESLKSWDVRTEDVSTFVSYITNKKKSIEGRKSGWKSEKGKVREITDGSKDGKNVNDSSNDGGKIEKTMTGDRTQNENKDESTVNMECTDSIPTSSDGHTDGQNVSWSSVLSMLQRDHDLCATDAMLPHVPLYNRHTNDTYMDRRNQLTGNKKERLDRHLQLKEENAESDPTFFTKMRGQGAV